MLRAQSGAGTRRPHRDADVSLNVSADNDDVQGMNDQPTPDDSADVIGGDQLGDLLDEPRAPTTAAGLDGGDTLVDMSKVGRPRRGVGGRMVLTAGAALMLGAGAAAATGGGFPGPLTGGGSPTLAAAIAEDTAEGDGGSAVESEQDPDARGGQMPDDETGAPAASIFDDPVVQAACDRAETHGEFVSGVASEKVEGEHHGTRVSEAAHSTCGKPDKTGEDDGAAKPDKPGKPDKPDKPGKPDKPDKPGRN